MKIIFLNCWNGEVGEAFFDFFEKQSNSIDIFCLMEVSQKLFKKLSLVLKNFDSKFTFNRIEGQAIFVKKHINIISLEKVDLYKQKVGDAGHLQKIKLNFEGRDFWVGSVHGKTNPGDKLDSNIRLKQSKKIIKSFDMNLPTITGGDFNLMPQTKSIKLFEVAGYRNLIKEFKIKATRNKIAWDRFQNEKGFVKQYFADYCFVTPDIEVKSFEVPNIEISDHLPLILDFEV